jgi:hypothetical protein
VFLFPGRKDVTRVRVQKRERRGIIHGILMGKRFPSLRSSSMTGDKTDKDVSRSYKFPPEAENGRPKDGAA